MKNAFFLSLASICHRPLPMVLCALSTACAIALLCVLFLLTGGIERGMAKNAKNIDLVVGAKGSPLQLVLSSVYHIDIPNGNIGWDDAQKIMNHPQVKKAIPIAIGDNYKGFRVVGTTAAYAGLYDLTPAQGRMFEKPFEVLAGAATQLSIGHTFAASHGFSADTEDVHGDQLYTVVGVLAPSGTAADKTLITPYQSVQQSHAHHDHEEHEEHDEHAHHDHDHAGHKDEKEEGGDITALLIQTKSPMAVMTLPRDINKDGALLAASPSYEMARLSNNIGIGKNLVLVLSAVLIALSTLMLFSNVSARLSARHYDLAILRVLGARPSMVFSTVLVEGVLIGTIGAVMGIAAGHALAYGAVLSVPSLQAIILPADMLKLTLLDASLMGLGVLSGILSAFLPALSAGRMSIASVLARGP